MKVRFTSVAWTGVSDIFLSALGPLQFLCNEFFQGKDYGGSVNQFVVVAIAIGEKDENEKFAKSHNKCGTDTHPLTCEKVKFISFALDFTQQEVVGKNETLLKEIFCAKLLFRLDYPGIKIPKNFNYESFSADMKNFLVKFSTEYNVKDNLG